MEVTQLQEEGRVLAGHLTEAQVELLLQALAVSPAPVSFVLVFVLGVCFRMCTYALHPHPVQSPVLLTLCLLTLWARAIAFTDGSLWPTGSVGPGAQGQ